MSASPELQSLAVEYARARARVLALKRQRNGRRCEFAERPDRENAEPGTLACWQDGERSRADWCDACQRGRALHREVLAAQRQMVGTWGRLSRLLARS